MRIELQHVEVISGGRAVLRGVDLALPAGSSTLVAGRVGAGLSTLLKVAAGLTPPSRGRVLQDGHDLAELTAGQRRRHQTRSGFVFQDDALWANQSVGANLALPLQAKHPDWTADRRQQRIAECVRSLGLRVDLDTRPAALPLGERRLVGFLRAVIPGPELLLVDEPLLALDGPWQDAVCAELAAQRARGVTLLMAARDPGRLAALADREMVLAEGRLATVAREVGR